MDPSRACPPPPWRPRLPNVPLSSEEIAHIVHDANRALQIIQGDPAPSVTWENAPMWQRVTMLDGVERALAGATPQEMHEGWLAMKRAEGWHYGPTKDASAKTHPCIVPYDRLPAEQRIKDELSTAIIKTLSAS